MSENDTLDNIAGTAKEVAGEVTGNEDLEKAGEQQQKKAQKAEEAERLEEKAEQKKQEAAGHAGAQKSHE